MTVLTSLPRPFPGQTPALRAPAPDDSPRPPTVRWETDTGHPIEWVPRRSGDAVFVCGDPDRVTALELSDGSVRWTADLGQKLLYWPVPVPVSDGPLLVQTENEDGTESWQALDQMDGRQKWSLKAADVGRTRWNDPEGRLYFTARPEVDGSWRFCCLDPDTGDTRWAIDDVDPEALANNQPPVFLEGTLYLSAGSGNLHRLCAIEPESGRILWSFEEGRWSFPAQLGPKGELVAFSEKLDAQKHPYAVVAHGFDARTGEHKWQRVLADESLQGASPRVIYSAIDTPLMAPDGTVLVAGQVLGGHYGLLALDPATGESRWSLDASGWDLQLAQNGDVLYGTEESDVYHLYRLDSATGESRWVHEHPLGPGWLPRVIQGPNGGLYAEEALCLRNLDPDTGKVRWESAPFEAAMALTALPGGVLLGSWSDSSLALVEADSGTTRWVLQSETPIGVDRTVGETMIVSTEAGHVLSADVG